MSTPSGKPRRRFVGTKSTSGSKSGAAILRNQIPPEILNDDALNTAIKQLPLNYSFEIHKTIHHVRKNNATMVALQMPEGLQMFACTIADIIEWFTPALTVILGDVTYGACCVDDYTATALGCDMLVHYGHSCLVPLDQTRIKTLYVFVEIGIDSLHLSQTIRFNFPDTQNAFHRMLLDSKGTDVPSGQRLTTVKGIEYLSSQNDLDHKDIRLEGDEEPSSEPAGRATRLALVSTIQFVAALQKLKEDLSTGIPSSSDTCSGQFWTGAFDITIPRSKPLSPGEILGCTAPRLDNVDALIYLGDGRFHLEAIMIANPQMPTFRYDPYAKKLTREYYDHLEMQKVRYNAVQVARKSMTTFVSDLGEIWAVVLGTLGRQGNFKQLQAITTQLEKSPTPIPYMPILLSELSPAKLSLFGNHISTFVQTSCPRLSIDWGYAFNKPLLSPYELAVVIGRLVGWMDDAKTDDEKQIGVYPMNFYEASSPWSVSRATGIIDG